MENNQKILDEIAKQFAIDYFSISDILFHPTNIDKIKKEIFGVENYDSIEISHSCNVRNIFVIGAGASYDCYKHIPLASEAIEIIKQNLEIDKLETIPSFNKKVRENKDRIKRVYSLNPNDFESQLAIFSNFITTEDIQEQLTKLYKKKWYPSLFYEILAHLFKHRFIDVIINFNFDELLDQALEEELSHDDYYKIYSDGQCIPLKEVLNNGRLKLPIYIKPHGTISHKSSLKFTKEDYFGLSSDMTQLLESIIHGERGRALPEIGRVNLIIVGSSMKSFEFNKILKEKLPEQSAIYFFSDKPPDEEFIEMFRKYYSFADGSFRFYQLDTFVKNNKLGSVFEDLYLNKFRKKMFTPLYEPKDIYRHKIINEVFYNNGKRLFDFTTHSDNSTYLLVRTYLEFIIAICKSKGRITLDELMQERFGYYYKLYYETTYSKDASIETIYTIFKFFELENESFEFSGQRIQYKDRDYNSLLQSLFKKFISLSDFSQYEELKNFSDIPEKCKKVEDWLIKIYEHDSLSISPKYNYLKFFTYQDAFERNIIPTKLSLIRKFISSIDKWDLVLISSNKGKILLNILNAENKIKEAQYTNFDYSSKYCCLVLEDDLYKETLGELISTQRLIDGKIHTCSKESDGDNIMLFLKRNSVSNSEQWKIVKGIVYHRINHSLKIFPYYVNNKEHLKHLSVDFFKSYCLCLNVKYNETKINKYLKEFAINYDKKESR